MAPPGPSATSGQVVTTSYHGSPEYIYPIANLAPTISVKLGQTFVIQLSSNGGSTGYTWSVSASRGISFLNQTLVSSSPEPGAPVVYKYFFRATQAGSQTILLHDMRQFPPYSVEATINALVSVSS